MAKSPAFQFYPDAWLSSLDITLMTPSEEGAYLRLLCHAWLSPDCGLPADSNALKSLSRLGVSWTKSEGRIRAKFREQDGRLYNDRLLAERTKQTIWREKSAEGGRRSVESKRQPNFKGGSRVVEECLQPNVNSLSLSSSLSLVKEETPIPLSAPKAGAVDIWFETEFWPKWLRRPDDDLPGPALKAARSVAKTVAIRKQIMAAVEACRADRQEKEPGYRVSARRWLREGMWEVSAVESAKPQELWPGQLGGRPHPDAIIRNFKKGDFIR